MKPGLYKPANVWMDNAEKRELALKKRLYKGLERWSEHTKSQPPLKPGQNVYIQNQRGLGKAGKRWDRSGVVLEDKGFDKYSIKVDGSGRITDRNRRFLKAFKPEYEPSIPAPRPMIAEDTPDEPAQRYDNNDDVPISKEYPDIPLDSPTEQVTDVIRAEREEVATPLPTPVPRSQRARKPNSLLNPDTWDLSTG